MMFSSFRDNLLFFRQAVGRGADHLYPIRDGNDLGFGISFWKIESIFSLSLFQRFSPQETQFKAWGIFQSSSF